MTQLFRSEAVHHATRRLAGEVVLASPLSVKTLGLLLAGVLFAAVAFATQASYARKATVSGLLIPDQGMIRATVQASGMLQAMMVKEGDIVKRGQHLAVVDSGAVTSGGDVGAVVAQSLESERVAANARAQATLARLKVEFEQSGIRRRKANEELALVRRQVALQEGRTKLAREEVSRGEAVAARGFLSRRELGSRQSANLLAEQELASQRRQLSTIERDIADIDARLASIPHEMHSAEAELQTTAASIRQRTADAAQRSSQFVVAPISGRVAALPVSTGQTIATSATVAIIIPEGSHLEAELFAPSRSIGFVKPGLEVRLSLQAFPYQRFGTVPGTIRAVSSTVLAPNEVSVQGLNLQEPVYRIRVTMSREQVYAYGEAIQMQPGMLVSADIVFDQRSLIEWLFDPIYAVTRRS